MLTITRKQSLLNHMNKGCGCGDHLVGERVQIVLPEGHALYTTKWWPKAGPVFGKVERIFKNGTIAVAVESLRNFSDDGVKTLHFDAAEIVEVGDDRG